MNSCATTIGKTALFFPLLASSAIAIAAAVGSMPRPEAPTTTTAPAHTTTHKVSPYHPVSVPESARYYYQSVWGVDNLLVRQTASGNLIRFSYRVTDPVRAKVLGDKKATPYLIGQRSRAVLQIPVMDKIGQLRQSGLPDTGKEYWMVFSNKGSMVKAGDRVNVVIGPFHADGLVVE